MGTHKVMKHEPTVSVIITCYNYAEYVAEAIESVLTQTYKNIEFIIIDDGSTDNSLKVINGYKDQATIVSRKNKGIVYTRNQALQLAHGEYVCFLDADDYFNKDYIANSVKVAEKYSADVVYPNWHIFGDNDFLKDFSEFDVQKLIRQEIHCTAESLFRRSSIGDHRFESEAVAEDWDFFLGLALDGRKFKLAKGVYINYRMRKNTRGSSRSYWEDMYHFCDILTKWSKKFPSKVNPFDLPITVGSRESKRVDDMDKLLKEKDKIIESIENTNKAKEAEINRLSMEITSIKSTKAYIFAEKLSEIRSKIKLS